MQMGTGELNKRIDIVTIETVQNDNGFETETEILYNIAWSKVANISGTEVFKAGADYSKVMTRFIVRYSKNKKYTANMKIRYDGVRPVEGEIDTRILYNIVYVNNYGESNQYIELVAEVVVL